MFLQPWRVSIGNVRGKTHDVTGDDNQDTFQTNFYRQRLKLVETIAARSKIMRISLSSAN